MWAGSRGNTSGILRVAAGSEGWLDPLKRRVYVVAFSLVGVAALTAFFLDVPAGQPLAVQWIFGPVVGCAGFALSLAIALRAGPLRRLEIGAFVISSMMLLSRLGISLLSSDAPPTEYTEFSAWIGAVLLLGFVMLDTRAALVGSVALYLAMLALAGAHMVVAPPGRSQVNSLVQQFVVVNALSIALLYVMARTKEAFGRAEVQALTDELTGVPNRRHIDAVCAKEVERATRAERAFSVILMDVDHFKRVNDQCGHHVGDAVLRRTAQIVRGALRGGDEIGRFGGEEFMVLAYEASADTAHKLAERLRQAVEHSSDDAGPPVTASFGVSEHRPGDTVHSLVGRADRALYRAKADGRNRVAVIR